MLYHNMDILKNLADIRDEETLSYMEAEYTSMRFVELVMKEPAGRFDFTALCRMHQYIFQDVCEWTGEIRRINIEKSEALLGGISIEYSDHSMIERDAADVLKN